MLECLYRILPLTEFGAMSREKRAVQVEEQARREARDRVATLQTEVKATMDTNQG